MIRHRPNTSAKATVRAQAVAISSTEDVADVAVVVLRHHEPIPRWLLICSSMLLAWITIISRRPDALLRPQFWAEDGKFWYADAYNLGWRSIFLPHAGYIEADARLTALLALAFSFSLAPLVFNIVAILIQSLPVSMLMSRRYDILLPDWRVRVLLVVLYLGLPNASELHGNLTNAHTYLALTALLIVLGNPPADWRWRAFDIGMLFLSGISGPFSLMFLPILGIRWLQGRTRWNFVLLAVGAATAMVQLGALLTSFGTRPHTSLGASANGFLHILAGNVYLGLLMGERGYTLVYNLPQWQLSLLPLLVTVLCTAVVVYAVVRGPLEYRLFVLYCAMSFSLALLFPLASTSEPQWPVLAMPGVGQRYFALPMLAFGSALIFTACRHTSRRWQLNRLKYVEMVPPLTAVALLVVMFLVGVIHDWRYAPYIDLHFQQYAAQFESAPAGTRVVIPINPAGWTMTLVKR